MASYLRGLGALARGRFSTATLVATLLFVTTGCDRQQGQLDRANAKRLAGELERAAELYLKAGAGKDPAVAGEALLQGARLELELGNGPRAEALCQEVTDRFSGSPPSGSCLRLMAEQDEVRDDPWGAIELLRSFLEQHPDDPADEEVRHRVGRLYLELGDAPQARLEWNEQIERHPEGRLAAEAAIGVARTHDVAGDCELASPAYRRVQQRHPTTPQAAEAMVGEAGCLESSGDLDAAERLYRKAQPQHPNPEMVLQRLEDLERSRWVRDPPAR